MAAVTQTVPNFLGGVSKQTDQKKQPGQVRDCLNAYPDPTFGLMKRPGFKFIKTIYTPSSGTDPELKDAKWFFIKRDNLETYIGCILDTTNADGSASIHASDPIRIWNKDGTACTVTYESSPDAKLYLDTTRDNYDVLTVQDTSIITNKTKTVTVKTAPSGYVSRSRGTIRIKTVAYSIKYEVTLTVGGTNHTVSTTTINAEDLQDPTIDPAPTDEKYNTAKRILGALKTALDALSISGHTLTVTELDASLELELKTTGSGTPNAAFTLTTSDSQGGIHLDSFQEQVRTQADLPAESTGGRLAKVVALGGESDTFWLKFIPDIGASGKGNWEETVDPTVSTGMNAATLPHELYNNDPNEFVFRQPQDANGDLAWKDRAVGDLTTNSDPSFVGSTIQQAFYHNNRLGFLTKDNVSMSKVNSFFNFYFTSALTATDSDPIDINCSSIRPAVLHAVIPSAQGLILFSKNQQFIMFSDAEILTPSSAVIRGISNYEVDSTIDPVDVGTTINFVSKTPSYTRIFGMQTRGSEESPMVMDIGKIVSEWVPDTVNSLLSSPQNSLIALYGDNRSAAYEGDNKMYIFKTYSIGDKMLMQAWFNWELPGNIQHASIDSDTMWSVVEYKGKYTLISASLTQTPEEKIIETSDGQRINPHMDLYGAVSSMTYDSTNELTKCYLPTGMKDNENLTPVLLIAGNGTTNFAGVTESGFTITPDRPTGQTHATSSPYFEVPNKNISGLTAADVIIGYKYNYDVELPKTYFKLTPDGSQYDYTANLTIARMKFAVGLSSVVGFKIKSKGYIGEKAEFTGDGSTTAFTVPFVLKEENGIRITLDGAKQASTAYTYTTTDTTSTVTFGTAPTGETTTANKVTPAQKIAITTDTWYDVQPSQDAGQYLADDVPLVEDNVFTIPIHQRSGNFNMRVFSNSPFPVSLTSMMWEGQYSPRFYRRT